jgi:glycosyltransferase involved in cell wall biosynthesis
MRGSSAPQARRIKVFLPIYGLDGGGAEKVVITLANHLDRARFEPVLVLLYTGGKYRSHVKPDVKVIELYAQVSGEAKEKNGRTRSLREGWKRHVKESLREHLPPEWIDRYKKIRHSPWVDVLRQEKTRLRESARNRIQGLRQRRLITHYLEDFGVWSYITQSSRVLQPLFEQVLDQEGPGAIVSNLLLANYLAIQVGASRDLFTAVCIHNTLNDYQVRVEYRKSPLSRADAVIAVSREVGKIFQQKFGQEKVRVIHNPHDIGAIRKHAEAPVTHPWFASKSGPVVMGIGRLRRQKNFQLLIDAVSDLNRERRQPVRLAIFGEGPERRLLLRRIRRHGQQGNISLVGWVSNPYKYLARADLFVLSSDWEGLPNTLIEALACGVPVISTDCPSGPREILEDGACGRLVKRGNRQELAAAIRGLLDDPQEAQALRTRGLARALEFDISRQVPLYEKLIREGMEKKRADLSGPMS